MEASHGAPTIPAHAHAEIRAYLVEPPSLGDRLHRSQSLALRRLPQCGERGRHSRALRRVLRGGSLDPRLPADLAQGETGRHRVLRGGTHLPHYVRLKPAFRLFEVSPAAVSLTAPVTLSGPPSSFCSALSVRSHLSSVLSIAVLSQPSGDSRPGAVTFAQATPVDWSGIAPAVS